MTHEEFSKILSNAIARELDVNEALLADPITLRDIKARRIARVAIAAVYAALKEPTPEMVNASLYPERSPIRHTPAEIAIRQDWKAMLAASPLAPKEGGE